MRIRMWMWKKNHDDIKKENNVLRYPLSSSLQQGEHNATQRSRCTISSFDDSALPLPSGPIFEYVCVIRGGKYQYERETVRRAYYKKSKQFKSSTLRDAAYTVRRRRGRRRGAVWYGAAQRIPKSSHASCGAAASRIRRRSRRRRLKNSTLPNVLCSPSTLVVVVLIAHTIQYKITRA